jgi:hypothetical protein
MGAEIQDPTPFERGPSGKWPATVAREGGLVAITTLGRAGIRTWLASFAPRRPHLRRAAFILGAAQIIFLVNFFWSIFAGRRTSERNPWHATTLEWTAPSPPGHGNFGDELPTVHRWPFDFSVPGEKEDFTPQDVPATVTAKN